MLDFSFSLVPFLIVGIGNFFVSWLYYSPAVPWFKTWALNVGMDISKKEMTEQEKRDMPRLMGGAVVASFLLAYGLQVLINSLEITTFLTGALAGVVFWFVFAVTLSLNSQFEGRKPVVLFINNVLYLLTYAGFSGLVAVL
jgi:UDP-N-acetylmuramyl pentapeptide phosphotransferase/UDP-N-acetylglucosamine-1-phosphate transferase